MVAKYWSQLVIAEGTDFLVHEFQTDWENTHVLIIITKVAEPNVAHDLFVQKYIVYSSNK